MGRTAPGTALALAARLDGEQFLIWIEARADDRNMRLIASEPAEPSIRSSLLPIVPLASLSWIGIPFGTSSVLRTTQASLGITAVTESDPDALPLTQAQLDPMVPMRILRGRPRSATRKQLVFLCCSPAGLACFRASGAGWQTRMDALSKDDVPAHARARDGEGADVDPG